MTPPKKYVKINGVMKLNPEYKKWKEAQGTGPATTVARPEQALPIVTNMEDHEKMNQIEEVPLSESTNATIEMMQEPEICVEAGMTADTMVDELGSILCKYEVPMGLMNKLMMLTEFEVMEFMIDDSGSMRAPTDSTHRDGRPMTRWEEAHTRLKEQIELLAYVPFNVIEILFLNDKRIIRLTRNGRDPKTFLADAYSQIDQAFGSIEVKYTTPYLEKLKESFAKHQGRNVARYFFGDGTPNGGKAAQDEITRLLTNRANPSGNPVTFLSCTNEDEEVEWMKDCEEIAPYCSESDDFRDEAAEVLKDQGGALPFSKGFHLVCQLVAAMNPEDLDAMDESIPFTKQTLDNLLGIQHSPETYQHYFNCYLEAQRKRDVKDASDRLKKNQKWNYQDFLNAPSAKDIAAVREFKQKLTTGAGGGGGFMSGFGR